MLAFSKKKLAHTAVADPGFPRDGGANPPGMSTYDFAKFSQKLHEIERIWIQGVSKILLFGLPLY